MKPEFEALARSIAVVGAITNETLSVIHHLFSADVPGAYTESSCSFRRSFSCRTRRPIIWIGGSGPAAMTRAVKFGDGWHPMLPAAELKAKVENCMRVRWRRAGAVPEIIVRRGLKLDDTSRRAQKSRQRRKPARPTSSWTWALPRRSRSKNRSRPS